MSPSTCRDRPRSWRRARLGPRASASWRSRRAPVTPSGSGGVLEQVGVVEPADRSHREEPSRVAVGQVGAGADRLVGGPHATHADEAPRQVAGEPRLERHQREQQRDHDRDHEDEPLELRAERRQWRAGPGERIAGDVADLRPPTSGSPASDSPRSRPPWTIVCAAGLDRAPGLGEARQELEQPPHDDAPEDDPDECREVGEHLPRPCAWQLAPQFDHRAPPSWSLRRRRRDRRGRGGSPFRRHDTARPLGRVQLPVDGAHDEPRGLGALAAELLALVLLERLAQVAR